MKNQSPGTGAERLFEQRFVQKMKSKDIAAFKKDYRTLYHDVIIPTMSVLSDIVVYHRDQRDAYFNEVTKQRETINELQEALEVSRQFILSQSATPATAEAYEKVNQTLIKSRNK